MKSTTPKKVAQVKKATPVKAVSPKVCTFIRKALEESNKDEKDVARERLEEFVELSKIELASQIAIRSKVDIPKEELRLKKAELEVASAKKNFEKVRYQVANSTAEYVKARQEAIWLVEKAQAGVEEVKVKIAKINSDIAFYEEALQDFQ